MKTEAYSENALRGFAESDPEKLIDLCSSASMGTRAFAIEALRYVEDRHRAESVILGFLGDAKPVLQESALYAVRHGASADIVAAVRRLAGADPNKAIREIAEEDPNEAVRAIAESTLAMLFDDRELATHPEPKVGEVVPDVWEKDWVLRCDDYDTEGVPKELQEYVSDKKNVPLAVGKHPDGRYFLVELDGTLFGWWNDLKPDAPSENVRRYQEVTRELLEKRELPGWVLEDAEEFAERLDEIWRALSEEEQTEVERWLRVEHQVTHPLHPTRVATDFSPRQLVEICEMAQHALYALYTGATVEELKLLVEIHERALDRLTSAGIEGFTGRFDSLRTELAVALDYLDDPT